MQELVAASGAPKSTILFYLNAGLLPGPVRTRPNVAFYDPACVERLRLIQHLKDRHRLSLSEVRRILESHDPSGLGVRLELNDIIFGRGRRSPLLDARAFCRRSGLKPGQLKKLLDARLLQPLEAGRFDAEDLGMGAMYARALAFGIRIEDLEYYVALGEKIVDREMELRRRVTGHLGDAEDAALTIEMVKNARSCRAYVIDRLFQHRVAGMRSLKAAEGGE
jgi:DNA-binding transcriptional MerR regulator